MQHLLKYFFAMFISLFLLTACEDPVDLDLGPPTEQLVIDAVINNSTDTQFIYVSKSVAYLQNGTPSGYTLDSIGIFDTSLFVYHPFIHKGNGVYFFVPPSANTFIVGKEYQLIARDGANTYVSQSKLNAPTTIDSLTSKYEEKGPFGGDGGNFITLWAKDKVGVGDFYWLRLYRNDSIQIKANDLSIAIDNAYSPDGSGDGNLFIVPIREGFNSRPWKTGEKAMIEILSVTPEMYYYVNLIRTQLQNTGLFAVPPSNVPSNIICVNDRNKKLLGFFSMAGRVRSVNLSIQ